MAAPEITVDSFLTQLSVYLKKEYTEEQINFCKNFNKSMICFASPGTGKTMSAIAGLLTAELYYRIPGNKIYALSFTRMATGEIASRHKYACRDLQIRDTINFKTLHSICTTILKENADKLGLKALTIKDASMQARVTLIEESCEEWKEPIELKLIPKVIRAINTLNSSLTFDEKNVKDSMAFKQCKVSYELFTKIRKMLFTYSMAMEEVQVGDIMLYTLHLLLEHPEVAEKFKSQCELMLVDEAQDLSLLQLKIISLLAQRAILIGDIKQQIYAFNGACQEIVPQFYKLFPDAITTELTHSFRCGSEIANFANAVIKDNAVADENMSFIGAYEGGNVEITSSLDIHGIITDVAQNYVTNRNNFVKDVLFLFRNNASAIPVAEALYKAGLPFRVNNYVKAFDIPVITDLVHLALLANVPTNPSNVAVLNKVISEFSQYKHVEQNPLFKIMTQQDISVFDINYQYKNQSEAEDVFNTLLEAVTMIHKGLPLKDVLNMIYPMYNSHYLKAHEYLLEFDKEYYFSVVNDLIREKTLDMFIQDELKKEELIKQANSQNYGVRCYTMHASKGLEADIVYILDADNGILPNHKKLKRMCLMDCTEEAAREIHNERSLCYVAATRAKEKLVIQYNTELSPFFSMNAEELTNYDIIYRGNRHEETDIEGFRQFVQTDIT